MSLPASPILLRELTSPPPYDEEISKEQDASPFQQRQVGTTRVRSSTPYADIIARFKMIEGLQLEGPEKQELINLSTETFEAIQNQQRPLLGTIYPVNLRTKTVCVFAVLSNSENILFVPLKVKPEVFERLQEYASRFFENSDEWIRYLSRMIAC